MDRAGSDRQWEGGLKYKTGSLTLASRNATKLQGSKLCSKQEKEGTKTKQKTLTFGPMTLTFQYDPDIINTHLCDEYGVE